VKREINIKRSRGITLLLAGSLATTLGQGCSREIVPPSPSGHAKVLQAWQLDDDQDQDNNTYVPGFGYYQSVYHTWFPYPMNWYYPGTGYYYGGSWNDEPFRGTVPVRSRPSATSLGEVHEFSRTGARPASWRAGTFTSTFGESLHGIFRGGFGRGFHFSS
jgi:hypothetical protein